MTAGTTGAEWAAVTVWAGPLAWQRTAAAIRAWIAAGELPVHPAMLPPCQCPAAELDEECCTVERALAELELVGVVERTGRRYCPRYYAHPLLCGPVPAVPRRVTLADLAARYICDESGDARSPYRARREGGTGRTLASATPGALGALIRTDWAQLTGCEARS